MGRETRVQSQVASYQRLKKWYVIPPCLTLSNISNPGKGVAPFPTHRCSSYWKRSLLVTLDYGHHQLDFLFMLCEMQTVLFMISIQAALSIFYDNNYCIMGDSFIIWLHGPLIIKYLVTWPPHHKVFGYMDPLS